MRYQPVELWGQRANSLHKDAHTALGDYCHYQANETDTLHSNHLGQANHPQPENEILTTNHTYSAMNQLWHFICNKTQA